MEPTLVLNTDYQPVSVVPLSTISWQDAVRILVTENANGEPKARAIESYDKWVIRSASLQLRMPSVIVLTDYVRHNGKVEFSRNNVILRDKHTCQYCQVKFPGNVLTFDHVIPRRDKGKTSWENIVMACYDCNQKKAHHNHMKPIRAPFKPTYWKLAGNRKKTPINVPNASWVQYLNWESDVNVINSTEYANVEKIDRTLPMLGEDI